jgi:hypothetical protein
VPAATRQGTARTPECPPPGLPPFRVEENAGPRPGARHRPRRLISASTIVGTKKASPQDKTARYGIPRVADCEYLSHRQRETALDEICQRVPLDRRLRLMQSIGIAGA